MVVHQSTAAFAPQFQQNVQPTQPAQTSANNSTDAPMVVEFHRRVAALMRIQQEMRDQKASSMVKEFGTFLRNDSRRVIQKTLLD